MWYSGAGGKLIHEKNMKQKIAWHCPFNCFDTPCLCSNAHSMTGDKPVIFPIGKDRPGYAFWNDELLLGVEMNLSKCFLTDLKWLKRVSVVESRLATLCYLLTRRQRLLYTTAPGTSLVHKRELLCPLELRNSKHFMRIRNPAFLLIVNLYPQCCWCTIPDAFNALSVIRDC